MKAVSFIIPIYNCERYIEHCVNELLRINLNNYEIILINDGSTDCSGVICDLMAEKFKKVCVIHQENKGVSAARNTGVKRANGEYIVFLDSDDSISNDKLKTILEYMISDTSIDMAIYGMAFDYYYRGKCYRRDKLCYPIEGKLMQKDWLMKFEQLYISNSLSSVCNKVFRKQILEKYDLKFQEGMFLYEDLEFVIRYMCHCNLIYNSTDTVYYYRQIEDEGNAGRRLKKIPHISQLINQIEDALDELIKKKNAEAQQKQIKSILFHLYIVLAREKMSVSSLKEIQQVCDDFSDWMKVNKVEVSKGNEKYVKALVNKQVCYLYLKNIYVQMRHKIAVKVKNMFYFYRRENRDL